MSSDMPGNSGQEKSLVSVRPRLKTVGRGRSISLTSQERKVGGGNPNMGEDMTMGGRYELNGTILPTPPAQLPTASELSPLRPTYVPSGQLVDTNICRQNLRRPNSSIPPPVRSPEQQLDNLNYYPGPVQQLLQQQTAQQLDGFDAAAVLPGPVVRQQLDVTDRDRQIARVEEELMIARRLMEIKNKGQVIKEQNDRRGSWQVDDPSKLVYANGGNMSDVVSIGSDNANRMQDMFVNIERARKEELERLNNARERSNIVESGHNLPSGTSVNLTKQKVKDMLERKKREMSLRNETSSSSLSSLKDAFTKSVIACDNVDDAFISDEEDAMEEPSSHSYLYKNETSAVISSTAAAKEDDFASVLGVAIPDQHELWEKIQREKKMEEKANDMRRQNKLAQEQQVILDKIREQNEIRKAEEELSMRLIAELSLADRRDEEEQLLGSSLRGGSASAMNLSSAGNPVSSVTFPALGVAAAFPSTSSPPVWWGSKSAPPQQPRFEDWSVVGRRTREKVASLKIAAELDRERDERVAMEDWRKSMLEREEEERAKQVKRLDESRKVRVVKSDQIFQDTSQAAKFGHNFRESLLNGNSVGAVSHRKKSSSEESKRELGARRKSNGMAEFEVERRKAAEELKDRIQAQERELRAKNEREALEREWELARLRKEKQTVGVLPPQLMSKEKSKKQKKKK